MDNTKTLFEQYFIEAPDDEVAPDTPPDTSSDNTSDETDISSPPDLPDDDLLGENDPPPDLDDGSFADDQGDFQEDDIYGDNNKLDDKQLGLDDKVSAIMNMNLYQRFLTMLTEIASQVATMKNNMDVLSTLSSGTSQILQSLNKLDENIRLYLKNYFVNENYSKNLLFFNKCLNLLKLLNDSFQGGITKGIKEIE